MPAKRKETLFAPSIDSPPRPAPDCELCAYVEAIKDAVAKGKATEPD